MELYVNPSTTTPQFQWLQAAKEIESDASIPRIIRKHWRSQTQLHSLMLAGQGDFWIGSLDSMAKCRAKGAPVKLLAVTGWRKWSLIGSQSITNWREAVSTTPVLTAPPENPAAPLLSRMLQAKGLQQPHFQCCEPKHLALQMITSKAALALTASPMTEAILSQNTKLGRLASLEDIKADFFGGDNRIPWAGIGYNENTIFKETAERFLSHLIDADKVLHVSDTIQIVALWPEEYHQTISQEKLQLSLKQDVILCIPATDIKNEIIEFFKLAELPFDDKLSIVH
ncbi:MAG: hypothetical protein IJS08_08720 [Victivallales bacterium]|nr:hypothetical protein [Victivallales bacterium]